MEQILKLCCWCNPRVGPSELSARQTGVGQRGLFQGLGTILTFHSDPRAKTKPLAGLVAEPFCGTPRISDIRQISAGLRRTTPKGSTSIEGPMLSHLPLFVLRFTFAQDVPGKGDTF